MALGIGSLLKLGKELSKGGLGPDELAEMLSTLGIEASFSQIDDTGKAGEFEALWFDASARPFSRALKLSMKTRTGEVYAGILVLYQAD